MPETCRPRKLENQSMHEDFEVLVVGGGHAGAQVAVSLRQGGFTGTLGIVSEESEAPYERPPLSKEYFSGEKTRDRISIRPDAFWEDKSIALRLNEQVNLVDPEAHVVKTQQGMSYGYAKLVWAAGGPARQLTCRGADLEGVLSLRTLADADRLRTQAARATRIVVIGGGYIGLEAAAVLSKLNAPVTLVEALDRVLARVAGEPLSRFYEDAHRSHGIDLRLGRGVTKLIEGLPGRVGGVELDDGTLLPADLVIVGIGIEPAIGPLDAAGAACSNGVLVDEFCRTSVPDIYAIGDCAAHSNAFAGGAQVRLESVQNANDMAATAAKHILGIEAPYHAVPWFWSNQYDLKLQTAGLSMGYDTMVVRGDMASGSFSVIYLKDGRMIALDCVNAMRDYVQGRKIIEAGGACDIRKLNEASIPLKDLTT